MQDSDNFKLIQFFFKTIFKRFWFIEMWISTKKGNIQLNAQNLFLNNVKVVTQTDKSQEI